ncbi:hypothetical protein EHS25_004629 [Saitozyma podzolica]|uniref:Elongator complex protein 4 n=1 Tax=Saitozyma podzolica TaxID=1890683 RepID=A0A427YUK2_9TREE|nr:hypothetical protein EHS25_004629 [Saitozyma podzolica]
MPSFTRRSAPTTPAAPDGTHPSPSTSQPLLPTGIPSFDDLLSGGLPLGGTLLVLAPDTHSAWSRLVARYFLAIGLLTSCRNVVVGEPGLGRELVKGCMWVDERAQGGGSESEGEDVGATGEGKGGKKIAWRYEGMKKFKTTVGGSNPLNLTKTLPSSALHEAESSRQQVYIPLDDDEPGNQLRPGPSDRSWPVLASALNRLRGILDEVPRGDKLATRVVINELGSVDWGDVSAQGIHRFLHSLRSLLRTRPASALITLPAELARTPPRGWDGDRDSWVTSLAWSVDGCVELRGFGDSPNLAPLYRPLHGLLTLHSFPTNHSILPLSIKTSSLLGVSQSATSGSGGGGGSGAGENNLGFRAGRKRFEVETVHLGIEGGTGERRTEPVRDVAKAMGTGVAPRLGAGEGEGGVGNEGSCRTWLRARRRFG